MSITITTVLEHTRQNTGTHFLDSGGASGRHWQQSAPVRPLEVSSWGDVSISLTHLLAEWATIEEDIQRKLDEEDGYTFEVGPAVMERLGYECVARDNTYNGENDLDQNYVYEVWQHPGSGADWIHDEEAIVLIYAHTGADVRGGYARPLAVRFEDSEYTVPVGLTVSYYPCEETNTDEWCEEAGVSADWFQSGYTSNPRYDLEQHVGEYLRHDDDEGTITFANPEEGGPELTFHFGFFGGV